MAMAALHGGSSTHYSLYSHPDVTIVHTHGDRTRPTLRIALLPPTRTNLGVRFR